VEDVSTLKIFSPEGTDPDAGAVEQMTNCMAAGDAVAGVLSADHHLGYSMPIGGTIAYPEYVSPSGVGYDIGCGNLAVATSLQFSDIGRDLPRIMQEINRRISFGMGRVNDEPIDHPVFDRIRNDFPLHRHTPALLQTARKQLGTVGGGNHYVDIFRDQGTDRVWIGVHFGSRGFGHKTASGFLALAAGKEFDEHVSEGGMMAPPTLLHVDSPLGHTYIEAMTIAGEYAAAGRETVVAKVMEILGNPGEFDRVHNHHNYAWQENHHAQDAWVVRKGATPLWPDQRGFIGSSMGEDSVIVRGRFEADPANEAWVRVMRAGNDALWSAPHGAGRQMSRTEAKGKFNRKTGERKTEGRIDWKQVSTDLKDNGIIVIGGDADEAPGAYKRLPAVLEAHADYVEVMTVLTPVGVVMAGPGIRADD
jgi:tRNA-splicing ligase RtcB